MDISDTGKSDTGRIKLVGVTLVGVTLVGVKWELSRSLIKSKVGVK